MSGLWKMIQFYKVESDHETIVVAAEDLEDWEPPSGQGFQICGQEKKGGGGRCGGSPHPPQSKSDQFLPSKVSPSPIRVPH